VQQQSFENCSLFPPTSYPLADSTEAVEKELNDCTAAPTSQSASGEQPEEWPEPEELGGDLSPVPTFDPSILPESLRPMVEDVAKRMQVPQELPAVVALAALAGCCNRRALVYPKRLDTGWNEVPNLWGVVVADPGRMKSPVIEAITGPLREMEAEWRGEYESATSEYAASEERAKLDKEVWREKYRAAAKAGKALPDEPKQAAPPTQRRILMGDSTFEALQLALRDNPAGLMVLRDELAGLLAGFEHKDRQQERSFYLESWNGKNASQVDRIGRGSINVPHCCLSLFGGIQPEPLRKYLASTQQDGLMQRFQLLVWPDFPKTWSYQDLAPNKAAIEQAKKVYRRIAAMDPANPLKLHFSDDAQELFADWLASLENRLCIDDEPAAIRAHLAKYRKLMPALSLLFALADNHLDSIPLECARKAATWCDFLEAHVRRVYGAQPTDQQIAALVLARKIEQGWKKGEAFSLRDVYGSHWGQLDTPDKARAALKELADAGWVRKLTASDSQPKTGRPSERYGINPKVYARA